MAKSLVKCNTMNCMKRTECRFTNGVLKCTETHCMKNVDGYCVHRVCPMENPDYRNPEQVAKEVEAQMQAQLKLEKEMNMQTKKK